MADTTSKWEDKLQRWPKPFLNCLGHKARADVSTLCLGTDWTGRSQERAADGNAAAPGGYDQLHHFIVDGVWDAVPSELEFLVPADRLVGVIDAVLVVDHTAMPKKGDRSVGVAPQCSVSARRPIAKHWCR
jgi:hypothetical protein